VAQKVWDDRYLSNADFAFIYPFFITEEINRLEKKFLELIQYNVTVKSNLYVKYYFELRVLFKDNEREFPFTPLNKRDADKLEINSRSHESKFQTASLQERVSSTFGGIESSKLWEW